MRNQDDTYVAVLDGEKSKDLSSFLTEIGKAFNFPDYYGRNMNALYDCLSDLSWIDKKNFQLIITNSADFLSRESSTTKNDICNFLTKVAYEWENVPNFEGEDQFRNRAGFQIIYK